MSNSGTARIIVLSLLAALHGWAQAQSAQPSAQQGVPIDFGAKTPGGDASLVNVPGFAAVEMTPVTPEASDKAVRERAVPKSADGQSTQLQSAESGEGPSTLSAAQVPVGPAHIAELNRALRNDPDLIYEYVRNNIEFEPMWGAKKGAIGAILDNRGTSFDQAALMVALLRQGGHTANFVRGNIKLTAAQARAWLGIESTRACAVASLLGNGQIPIQAITATAAGNCPGSTADLVDIELSHVWVKAVIGGTAYHFDPSFKPSTLKAPLNLAAITGYSASTFLANAKSGATVTADYVQNVNRTNIRNNLTTYANNTVNWLRANRPAATLDDVIGGPVIQPHAGDLRQTALPHAAPGVALTEWTDIPDSFKTTLRIRYRGIDKTYSSDALHGKRLTLTYNASTQPELRLDGSLQGTGTAIAAGTQDNVLFDIVHGAYAQTISNQSFTQSIRAGGTFLIGNAWGRAGRGPIDFHRERLEAAKAAGTADTSELVMGSTLAVLSANWTAQSNQATLVIDRLAKTNTLLHHQVGIAGYSSAAYVDLPGNRVSVVSETGDAVKQNAAFFSQVMHASIFESAAVQQTTGASAVSTVKLLDLAASTGDFRIYDARSASFASKVRPGLQSCSTAQLDAFQAAVNGGSRLILPSRCNLTENSWTGLGYFSIASSGSSTAIGALISGNLFGGFSTTTQSAPQTTSNTLTNSASPNGSLQVSTGKSFGDPIDMTKGHYLYSREDISVGTGSYPMSLNFEKLYSSGLRHQGGPLGKGWTHNYAASAKAGSDALQGLGEDSALDAAAAIAEAYVSLDLMSDATRPLDKMVVATLASRWLGDQLIKNTVILRRGLSAEVFTKLPDGTYNPPPGNSGRLSLASNLYSYETVHKNRLAFDASGRIATHDDAGGVRVKFTYSGNDLTTVENSLGRKLTFTYASGRITKVSDGARSVGYAYDAAGNLVTYTDALAQETEFKYSSPGAISQLFYPSFPTTAFLTNSYDALGRVRSQANAHGKVYSYFFAGSRSEEVGPAPAAPSRVSYVDVRGNVLKSIDPTGRTTTNTYDGQARLVKSVLPEGNRIEIDYDDAPCASQKRCTHNVKTVRKVAKAGSGLATLTSSFTYEAAFNRVAKATDARGLVTDYTYTAQGQPASITEPADAAGARPLTTIAYSGFTPSGWPVFYLPTSVTRKINATASVVDTTAYNASNKYVPQSRTVDAGTGKLNLVTAFTYDAVGNLTQTNGPRIDVTDTVSVAFDAERRPTVVTDALGKLTRSFYDADGRLTRTAAQASATQWLVSCRSYSVTGKPLSAWGPSLLSGFAACPTAGGSEPNVAYAYDELDRPIRATQLMGTGEGGNRVSETTYDKADRVTSVKRAVGSPVAQTYSTTTHRLNGQVATVEDARGNLTTYEYDGHDRLFKLRYPDKTALGSSSTTDFEQYGYDANGNLTSRRTRAGVTIGMGYDGLNRLTSRTYPAPYANDSATFGYDLLGRMTSANESAGESVSFTWDAAGRMTSTTAAGRVLSFLHDAAGNRTRTTWPDAFYASTTFDALNRSVVLSETRAGVTSPIVSYSYDDLSRRTLATRGNTTSTSYSYGPHGALAGMTHQLAGTADDQTYTYTRNRAQEITSQSWSNDLYEWDVASNVNRSYTSNGLNQYTAAGGVALTYDANGNLASDGTWSYGYDPENRLVSASSGATSASLSYDALGRLSKTTIAGAVTQLDYEGDKLVGEYDAAGTLARRTVHGPGTDEPVWYQSGAAGFKRWMHADHLGTIVARSQESGVIATRYAYGPYGELRAGDDAINSRFRYTGQQYLHELGLHHYKARFYSVSLGRFLQTDPIGTADDLNLYAYVGGDPLNLVDPSGLMVDEAVMLTRKVGEDTVRAIGDLIDGTYAAGRNQTFGDTVGKIVGGLPVGAAAIGAVGKIGSAAKVAPFSHLVPGGGLAAHEAAGGHLIARHVGQSEAALAARLAAQPRLGAASTFASRAEAEAAISGALNVRAANVNAWVEAGARGRLVIDAPFNGGTVLQRGAATAVPGTGAKAVLEGTGGGGWRIITGYPTP